MKKIVEKYKIALLAGTILIVIVFLPLIPQLKINTDFSDYIPNNVGNRAYLNKLDSIFGGNEKVMLILENEQGILTNGSFERIGILTEALSDVEGIEHCLSLLDAFEIKMEDGITEFVPLIDSIPAYPKQAAVLKQKISSNKMGQRLVSSDFTSTAIILTKENDITDKALISEIQKVIDQHKGKDNIYLGGLSYIRQSIKGYIKTDLITLLPGGLLLMLVMLFVSFKEWKGVFLPFIVVILAIIFSFALMAIMDWQVSIISILLPIMLIAIANDYSIHLINLYQEKSKSDLNNNSKDIVISIYHELKKPIIITALTTIGGMLGLLSHQMPPAVQLGLLASFGIGLALLMSLFLVPVLLTYNVLPQESQNKQHKKSILDNILKVFSTWVNNHPRKVLASFLLISVISIGGLFLLKVDTNVESYFLGKSKIRKGIELVNKKFGGSQYVSVLFNGNILSPDMLHRMEKYVDEIRKIPHVGHIISPNTFLKELSKGIYKPGETGYNVLPSSEAEAEQFLTLLSFGGYDDQLTQILDYNYENARLLVSMTDGSNKTGKSILKALNQITKNDPNLVCIAGPGLSKIQIADMVIHGQITSLFLALLIIFIMLLIIFRSFSTSLKGSLPLVLSCLFLFGLMGFLSIPLDIVTALLSSIMIGVGVDYTIHFLWRYKEEHKQTNNVSKSIATTMTTTGRGIVFNAFSVIVGFSVLIFSSFGPLRFFGVLVVVSIFSCLISALLLVPALIKLTQTKYNNTEKPII